MKKIALLSLCSPFRRGGAEVLVDDLENELKIRGHFVDIYMLPEHRFLQIGMLIAESFRFDEYDYVICFKFPLYCVKHHSKIVWMFHQFRQGYELYGTEFGLPISDWNDAIKRSMEYFDNTRIRESKYYSTIGDVVSERLLKYNGIEADIIYPPLQYANKYYWESCGDYVYYPSRINNVKRQHLLVEAMKYTKTDARAVISGVFETREYKKLIMDFIEKNNIGHKVKIIDKWITDEEKRSLFANSLAGVFTTYSEDYGYITLEIFYSHKPLITCTDSGGPCAFVKDGETGFITEPEPKEIAKAIDKLYSDRQNAQKMGELAYKYIVSCNITWDETIRRLLK